jgi:hypothetical protein
MHNLETITDKYYKISNTIQLGVYSAALYYGEHLKHLAEHKLRNYDWMQGHLGDIAGSAGLMTCLLYTSAIIDKAGKMNKIDKLVIASLVPVVYGFSEILQKNGDWQDTLCYTGGALLAWTIPHAKEIFEDTKAYFQSKILPEFSIYKVIQYQSKQKHI